MGENGDRRLDGWQAIGDYLGCHLRTVIRWEREHGLPVHRVQGSGRSPVYAFTAEIDAWLRAGRRQVAAP